MDVESGQAVHVPLSVAVAATDTRYPAAATVLSTPCLLPERAQVRRAVLWEGLQMGGCRGGRM